MMQLHTVDIPTGKVTKLPESLANSLAMANGATNFPGTDDSIALLTQGKGDWQPGAVNKLNLRTLKYEVLLDNYLGRQFNSPNDIAFYKDGRMLFFTDPPYGFAQNFKLQPQLGNYVYAYDTVSKIVSVAADGFVKPNGVAFSPDYKTAYVTDTGMADVSVD
jgi:gluconolactonase